MRITAKISFVIGFSLCSSISFSEAITLECDYAQTAKYSDMVDTAIKYLESESPKAPSEDKLRFALGTLYYSNQEFDQAIKQFEAFVKLHPNHAEGYFYLGLATARAGNEDKFIEYMEKTIRLNPSHVRAYNSLAKFYALKQRFDQVQQVLDRGRRVLPKEESFFYNHALLLMCNSEGHRETVITIMKEAITLHPVEGNYFILGLAYLQQRQYEAARTAMQKVLQLNPKNVIALLTIATAYKEEKNFEKAIEIAEKTRAIAEQTPELAPSKKDVEAKIQEFKKSTKSGKRKSK